MTAEKKLTRAEFFNWFIKKSMEKAVEVGDELIKKASTLGLEVNEGVVLCGLEDVSSTPKKIFYRNNTYFLWAWNHSFALTYSICPHDRFPLMLRREYQEFFCPLCQKSWSWENTAWQEIGNIPVEVIDSKVLLSSEAQSLLAQ
ncbi:hypothetical protein [Carboxydocella sporoproducens]|nr:hypothetical protein [Carboxydocella sporoproducens]